MHAKRLEELPLTEIVPNRFQPRIHFDDEKIDSLAKSIIKYGVLEPIIVRPVNGKFEIIAGERRYKASKYAGKTTIPSIIVDYDDKESIELALLENVQRQELTAIEEAIAYRRILDMGYITQEELAKKTGKSQPTIANKMRLLMLDDETQDALINHKISERHARSLLKLVGTGKELEMLNRIIKERLTVRETDNEIAILLGAKKVEEKPSLEKNDEFFTKEGEKINKDVSLEKTKVDMGPVFIAEKETSQNKVDYETIESLFDDIEPKAKEEKGENGFMDIEKIMQEAQDINAKVEPENKPELVTTPSPYDTIMGPNPVPLEENTVPVQEAVMLEEQNKFINVVPVQEETKEPEKIVAPEPTVTFDSIFNTNFNTVEPTIEEEKNEEVSAINDIEAILSSSNQTETPVTNMVDTPLSDSDNEEETSETSGGAQKDIKTISTMNITESPNLNVTENNLVSEGVVNPVPQINESAMPNISEMPVIPEVTNIEVPSVNSAVPEVNTIYSETSDVNNFANPTTYENLAPTQEVSITPAANDIYIPTPEVPVADNIMNSNATFESQMSVLNEDVPKIETPVITPEVPVNPMPAISEVPEVPVSPTIETPTNTGNLDIPEFTSTIAENAPVTIEEPQISNMSFDSASTNVIPEVNISEMPNVVEPSIVNPIPTEPVADLNNANLNINSNEVVIPNNDNFDKVIELVRNCSKQIEELGYSVNVNELDLLSNYQITFNIEKH